MNANGLGGRLSVLELSLHSFLLVNDCFQCAGHPLELLLVSVMKLVHALGKRSMYHLIVVSIPGGGLMYHGDNFPQEGESFVL